MTATRITQTLLNVMLVASLIFFVIAVVTTGLVTVGSGISLLALVVIGSLWILHQRGWRYSAEALVIVATLLSILAAQPSYIANTILLTILIPPILAAILLSPRWSMPIFVTMVVLIALRALISTGGDLNALGPTYNLINLGLLVVIVIGSSLASNVARAAQREAEANAAKAQAATVLAEANAQALEHEVAEAEAARTAAEAARIALADQIRTITQQREVIREMSVPVLPITPRALLMPLVGALDSERIRSAQERALTLLEQQRGVRYLLLDITGVPVVDSQVAGGLIKLVQAARLLGAQVIVVGIRPEVAQTVVGLGLDLSMVATRSSLQEGVNYVLTK
ncbi:MAG: STAS domain-containing protein [Oscillochloridaceae bacterium umkhey_bin13]